MNERYVLHIFVTQHDEPIEVFTRAESREAAIAVVTRMAKAFGGDTRNVYDVMVDIDG